MSNEIKVGDKVRVSKDILMFYRRYNSYRVFEVEHQVVDIEDGIALLDSIPSKFTTILPTKYLVKVDAEAKEAKFKVGQCAMFKGRRVEVIGYSEHYPQMYRVFVLTENYHTDAKESDLEPYTEPTAPKYKKGDRVRNIKSNECGIVHNLNNGVVEVGIPYVKPKRYWDIDIVELIQPTEQTEAEKIDSDNLKKVAEEWANTVSDAIKEYGDAMCQTYIDAHTEAYWDAYAADLAKELALKVANKFNNPKEAAEYAVKVAKSVVEGLKRK